MWFQFSSTLIFSWLCLFLSPLLKLQRLVVRVTVQVPVWSILMNQVFCILDFLEAGIPDWWLWGWQKREASGFWGTRFQIWIGLSKETYLHDFSFFFSKHCFLSIVVKSNCAYVCVCVPPTHLLKSCSHCEQLFLPVEPPRLSILSLSAAFPGAWRVGVRLTNREHFLSFFRLSQCF